LVLNLDSLVLVCWCDVASLPSFMGAMAAEKKRFFCAEKECA
jgi:hypothetical protein